MYDERPLDEPEKYLRLGGAQSAYDGIVDMSAGDATKRFEMGPARSIESYFIPSLLVTIAGPELLDNYHRFGKNDGELRLAQLTTDDLGVQWDRLSGRVHRLGTDEDWVKGVFDGTRSDSRLTEAGKPPSVGNLVPITTSALGTAGLGMEALELFPFQLPTSFGGVIAWRSATMDVRGARVSDVGWEVSDAVDKHLAEQHRYRIDIQFLRRSPHIDRTYSLTHTEGVTSVDPVTVPVPAPIGSLGTPVASAMRTQTRSLGNVDPGADSVRIIVYFDLKDPNATVLSHVEDLLRRPPIVIRLGVYSRIRPSPDGSGSFDPSLGRREAGVYRCLRDLIEAAGELRSSARSAYRGDDIAWLHLPISTQLRGRNRDRLVATFSGDALSLLEIKAVDGLLSYGTE
ncbi:MAG: hypothetical protein M5T61_18865 [Acidimicrobiia bacterium]|nr:hypothetical protein [Acidimicrobiia bacterium]